MALVSATWLASAPARASGDEARRAYDEGAAAYDRKEYLAAARSFARADALSPNDEVLSLALGSSVEGGDPVLAISLSERAVGRPSPKLAGLANTARSRFAERVGHVVVLCPAATTCSATLDGAAVTSGERVVVLAGSHRVVANVDGREVVETVELKPREERSIAISAPASAPMSPLPVALNPPARPLPLAPETKLEVERDGISPVWFFAAAGATAVLGGLTVWSGLDSNSQFDEFKKAPTESGRVDGEAADLRTNVLLVSTIVLAAATGTIAYFTNFSGLTKPSAGPRAMAFRF